MTWHRLLGDVSQRHPASEPLGWEPKAHSGWKPVPQSRR